MIRWYQTVRLSLAAMAIAATGCGSGRFYDEGKVTKYSPEQREEIRKTIQEAKEYQGPESAADDTVGRKEFARVPATVDGIGATTTPTSLDTSRHPPVIPTAPQSGSEAGDAAVPLPRIPARHSGRSPTARIMVYASSSVGGAVNVLIDDLTRGGLMRKFSSAPACGASGSVTLEVQPGEHKLYAEGVHPRATWGPVARHIRAGECFVWRLDGDKTRPGTAAMGSSRQAEDAGLGVRVAFWTRRSLNLEHLDLFVDGRPVVPASWSFPSEPIDCGRLPMYAVKDYQPGDQVRIEVRKSRSADVRTPVVFMDRLVVPSLSCYLYEIR